MNEPKNWVQEIRREAALGHERKLAAGLASRTFVHPAFHPTPSRRLFYGGEGDPAQNQPDADEVIKLRVLAEK